MSWRLFRKPKAPAASEASDMSPARLLAASLTAPETRGEWKREVKCLSSIYRNEARDLELVWVISAYSTYLTTPFKLSEAEKKVVWDAIAAFDNHLRLEKEKAALARLIAPAPAKPSKRKAEKCN